MNPIDAITITVSFVALLVSIGAFVYSIKRTKIMEKQLEQQQKLFNKKKKFEEASEAILKAIKKIKENAKPNEFFANPLDISSSNILEYLHDNPFEKIELIIKPEKLTLESHSFKKEYTIEDFKDIKRIIADVKKVDANLKYSNLNFKCIPVNLPNPWLEYNDTFYYFAKFYEAFRTLKEYEKEISFFDNRIVDYLEERIDALLTILIESIISEHKIIIKTNDKSTQIYQKLLNALIGLDSMRIVIKEILEEICEKRLIKVQKEMFNKT